MHRYCYDSDSLYCTDCMSVLNVFVRTAKSGGFWDHIDPRKYSGKIILLFIKNFFENGNIWNKFDTS